VPEPRITEDPHIAEIAQVPTEYDLRVFASSRTLAALVSAPRTAYPFHLFFEKSGTDLYVTTRTDDSPALIETNLETITTAQQQLPREKLMAEFRENIAEATLVNRQFVEYGKEGKNDIVLGEESTFPAVYRSIVVRNIEFIVRCPIDAIREPPAADERPKYVVCRTFNDVPTILRPYEWDNLPMKRGATLSAEAHANASKVARWVAMAQLMGADACFLGYTIRKQRTTSKYGHLVIGVEKHTPKGLGDIISLPARAIYGMLNLVFSKMISVPDGVYAFLRDSRTKRNYGIYNTVGTAIEDASKPKADDEIAGLLPE
jgi:hypothetical protein